MTGEEAFSADLRAMLRALSLPEPTQVLPGGQSGSFAWYDLTFDDLAPLRWQVAHPRALRRPFEVTLAAHALLADNAAVPVCGVFRLGRPPNTHRWVALRDVPTAPTLEDVVRDGRMPRDAAFRMLGTVIAGLHQVWGPAPGCVAEAHRFVPDRGGWPGTVAELARLTRRTLHECGVDLGQAQQRLFDELETWRRRLPPACDTVLVHGNLALGCIRTDGQRVVEVESWEHCLLGDPLAEWGGMLHLAPDDVRAMLAGAGQPDLLDEDEAEARLRVGYLAYTVIILGAMAPALAGAAWEERAVWLDRLRTVVVDALARDPLAVLRGGPLPDRTRSSPVGALLHRVAEVLRSTPRVEVVDAEALAGAVACLELASRRPEAVQAARTILARFSSLWTGHPEEPEGAPSPQPPGPLTELLSHRHAALAAKVLATLRAGLGEGLDRASAASGAAWQRRADALSRSPGSTVERFRWLAVLAWAAPDRVDDTLLTELTDLWDLLPAAQEVADPVAVALGAVGADPLAPAMVIGLALVHEKGFPHPPGRSLPAAMA
ncbi:MAG: hypothetical protein H6738_00950 [Alphaproteobacteria bacterium]|nr:hypothetical protein [Alphaproteobacteria bacterium]